MMQSGSACWDRHWIYWAGPFLGAALAACVATLIFLAHPNSIKTVLLISRGEEKFKHAVEPALPANEAE